MKKRILAAILVLTLVLSLLPASVFATGEVLSTDCIISVDSTYSMAGDEVKVNVGIKNNPGILGATLHITWSEGLTMQNAENGNAFSMLNFTKPSNTKRGGDFVWYGEALTAEQIKDGNILTITFAVAEDAVVNEAIPIDISFRAGDIFDNELQYIAPVVISGEVLVLNYKPGDANGDKRINAMDLVFLCRYIADGCKTDSAGYNVTLNESAGDVNDDGRINAMDLVLICRYIADGCETVPDGYNIILKPATPKCAHELVKTDRKAAECEKPGNLEYWQCTKCQKYYKDAAALTEIKLEETVIPALEHEPVVDPAVAPTYTTPGKTEGSHCDVCGAVIIAQENIDPIKGFSIEYVINQTGDTYLAQQEIDYSKFVYSYTPEDETILLPVPTVPGYVFQGWFDAPGETAGNQVVAISKGSTGNKIFYARWKLETYTVMFESDLIPEESITYQVDKGTPLPTPKLDGYIFVGWSDDEGKVLKTVPVGTVGHKTYSANWISERNQAWAKKKLDDPIVYEDDQYILYTYEIGEIRNVPLYVIHDFGKINSNGVTKTEEKTYSTEISSSLMKEYTNIVSNATTNSFDWTLANSWSKGVSIDEQWLEETGLTEEEAVEVATSESGEWYISSGASGTDSTETIDTTETYDLTTKTKNKKTYNVKDTEKRQDFSAGLNLSTKTTLGIEGKVDGIGLSGGKEWAGGLDLKYANGKTTNKKTGTEKDDGQTDQDGTIQHDGTTTFSSSSWNMESGQSGSASVSESQAVSKAISEKISQTLGYGENYIQTEDQSNTLGHSYSNSNSNEYSSSVSYSTVTSEQVTKTYTTENTMTGYHRWIMAGTAHVFAIVGYDIEKNAYFVNNFTVMDDEMHEFEDYSYSYADYKDNQNGVIPFEAPSDIIEHVAERVNFTEGLEVNKNGEVTAYRGDAKYVIIPEYKTNKNSDGSNTVIKITGISANAFKGNQNIEFVELSEFVTNIPDRAFEGCSSLISVEGKEITTIGKYAFAGCTELKVCKLGENLISIGEGAFDGVESIYAKAANANIVKSVIACGAKNIEVAISDKCTDLKDMTLEIPSSVERFVFYGYGKTYSGLVIESNAKETEIIRAALTSQTEPPLKLASAKITLQEVTLTAPAIALVSSKDASIILYGESNLFTNHENAMLCKSVQFSQFKDDYYSALNVNGNVLCCGQIEQDSYLKIAEGSRLILIDETQFENFAEGFVKLIFDANGGSVDTQMKEVNCGVALGALPVPTRTGFGFDGWYTANGERIAESTVFTSSQELTLTAKWTVNSYTVNWKDCWGCNITVKRTSSPYAGAATGTLSKGAAIYYGDVLQITYTAQTGFTMGNIGKTAITVTGNVTASDIYATAYLNEYTVSWSTTANGSITVKRTSSPYAGAASGVISNGAKVYYGDVITVTYGAATGYSISSKGGTSYTVTRNITGSDIYLTVAPNQYTYNVVYQSSNGTILGTTTSTNHFGGTFTVPCATFAGYDTPASQSIKWDSTSAKTITFIYTPSAVATTQHMGSGVWIYDGSNPYITFTVSIEYRNRTANSVEIRSHFTNTLKPKYYYGYDHFYNASFNGWNTANTGEVRLGTGALWGGWVNYERSNTGSSEWVEVPLTTTNQVNVEFRCDYWGWDGTNGTITPTNILIPAY